MAQGITTAFWGMTINNYDETDLALVQNGYPDFCREIVHTLEKGSEGTPHIQAWVKLQRQQRLSFVKKLFPRGHFKPLTSDEYIQHTKVYAQKLDDSAVSGAVHRFNDPLHTIESVCRRVSGYILYADPENIPDHSRRSHLERRRLEVQQELVMEDFRYAKVFVSATYRRMWDDYGFAIIENILRKDTERAFSQHTHTHTHNENLFSQQVDIPTDASDYNEQEGEARDEDDSRPDCEGDEDSACSEDEGYDTSGSSSDCSEDDG